MSAHDRGWGGPGCSRKQLAIVPCAGIQLNIRREVAPLFAELVRWLTERRRATGVAPLSSSGGYNKRYIDGTTTWSNHSWGLAGDFNAATNPYAVNGRSDMPPGTSAKARELGMRWGGDYAGKRDAMHFEFMGTPQDAARLVAELTHAHVPEPAPPALPPPPSGDDEMDRMPVLRRGSDNTLLVRMLQGLLVAHSRIMPVDGDFGPATEAALREWQGAARVAGGADGVCGPNTWGRFLGLR